MKRLFYIEKEKFLCEMIVLALKPVNIDCYTLNLKTPEQVKENLYLVSEMAPDVILFDIGTLGVVLEELIEKRDGYDAKVPLIATGSKEEFDQLSEHEKKSISKLIEKPLSPTGISRLLFD